MNYESSIRYLNSFINYERWISYNPERAFNLDRMRRALKLLGNPDKQFPSVLIAGTKGKGSTAAILESILRCSGCRTGMYTSPHLLDLRERVTVNGQWITKHDFARGLSQICAKLGNLKPTYFEMTTLLAFLEFARRKVDIAVVEAGLGGRLDATNVLEPVISIITSISYDHEKELGSTLSKIAAEKAGIIHPGSVVLTAPQEKEVLEVIRKQAARQNAFWLEGGKEIRFSAKKKEAYFDGKIFPLRKLALAGDFQIENAAVAISAAQLLSRGGFGKITPVSIQKGLSAVRWPGRMESVEKNPHVILDGAHNGESMEAAVQGILNNFPGARIIPVLGLSQGKDLKRMLEALKRVSDTVILTEYQDVRAWSAQDAAVNMNGNFKNVMIASPVSRALDLAKLFARKNDVILVTGSLYLIGELKKGR